MFEGLTRDECVANHPDAWRDWVAQTSHPPGGEPRADAIARMQRAMLRVVSDGTTLVVSHGGVMRLWLMELLGTDDPARRQCDDVRGRSRRRCVPCEAPRMKDVAVVVVLSDRHREGAARRAQPDARHPDDGARAEATRSTRAEIEAGEIEDVVIGCGLPEGATGHNIARNAALDAGFGDRVPGMTINRYCGSGLSARRRSPRIGSRPARRRS